MKKIFFISTFAFFTFALNAQTKISMLKEEKATLTVATL